MMVLVPSDSALRSSVPSPLLLSSDVRLQRYLLAGHIVTDSGAIPQQHFRSLPALQEIPRSDLWGRDLLFMKDSAGVFHVNGIPLSQPEFVGRTALFAVLEDRTAFPVDREEVEAAERRSGVVYEEEEDKEEERQPLLSLQTLEHLRSASVPALRPRVAYALRLVGAGRFADLWLDVKRRAREEMADLEGDRCFLPVRTVGGCGGGRGVLRRASFYYDSDLGTCRAFAHGGDCAGEEDSGKENRFNTLLECSE